MIIIKFLNKNFANRHVVVNLYIFTFYKFNNMDFQNNTTQIILAIIAIFAVGIIVKISINKNSKKTSNSKNLNNVNAGGDIVFGNKKTKNK